ncbi:MAG: hypothetical protein J6P37_05110 [Lachnospiraceae bacterium]|nr:hypothetical protein [Lachnospiraceae bacterium]
MRSIKDFLIYFRNAMSFVFSWLVICSVILMLLLGSKAISIAFLIKLFVLCLWGVITFGICFLTKKMQKKGFIFSLTIFYVLFIPVEVAMFYFMGMFSTKGNVIVWSIFGAIVVLTYITCLVIEFFVLKKRAADYTKKVLEYKAKSAE